MAPCIKKVERLVWSTGSILADPYLVTAATCHRVASRSTSLRAAPTAPFWYKDWNARHGLSWHSLGGQFLPAQDLRPAHGAQVVRVFYKVVGANVSKSVERPRRGPTGSILRIPNLVTRCDFTVSSSIDVFARGTRTAPSGTRS